MSNKTFTVGSVSSPVDINVTGTLTAPTPTSGSGNTQVATKGYVDSAIPSVPTSSSTSPKMDGTATVGTETTWAHGDHVHPTDTSRQSKITASGILKGNGSGGVSAATAGTDYAAASHNHSASDITSGTLSVARGGTGITTSTYVNAVVVGNASTATNALRTIRTASGAFYATAQDGAPTFGTLPAAQGGTGNTSLQATRNAMGLGNTTGALPIANGGTGLTASPSMLTNLGSTTAANVLAASPRPGVTGTLPVGNGGTGATTLTSGAALIGAGTGAVTTRSITNNTATTTALTANTNLVTANTVHYAICRYTGRTTLPSATDINYTTYMFRGQTLNSSATNASVNGSIAWQYE